MASRWWRSTLHWKHIARKGRTQKRKGWGRGWWGRGKGRGRGEEGERKGKRKVVVAGGGEEAEEGCQRAKTDAGGQWRRVGVVVRGK